MKRIGFIGVSFGLVLFLTGCGNTKTLTCTKQEENYYGNGAIGYRVTYKSDIITTVEQKVSLEVTDEDYEYYLDNIEDEYEKEAKEKESIGVNYNLNRQGNNLVFGITYNLNKMTDDELNDFGYSDDDNNSYEKIKSEMEEDGFTCK